MIDPIDLERLCAIGLAPQILPDLPAVHADDRLMRVAEVQRDGVSLHDGTTVRRAHVLPALRAALDDDAIAVGDWVYARLNPLHEWGVSGRVPPANQIARRVREGEQVTRVSAGQNPRTFAAEQWGFVKAPGAVWPRRRPLVLRVVSCSSAGSTRLR